MKKVLQDLKSGATTVTDVPPPQVETGHLLIRTRASVISAGTERMVVEFGRASLVKKASQQPEKVRQVWQRVGTDGLLATLDAVQNRLDQPISLGYCNVGTVVEIGHDAQGIAVGDRVVSNGAHAEVVCVPQNLCAKVPDDVADDDAAFTVLGAIALQGVRLANPTLGEAFIVIGLGLIGLLTVQLLRANGCRVLGLDFNYRKLELARQFGTEVMDLSSGGDLIATADSFSRGRGADGVLITASTKSNDPVRQAAAMCRKRGRIVLVGVTGLELSRKDFYEKELSFQVSCSYGPGRYDPEYEQKGHDYPIGFVRWTEQRNFEAVLDMLASGMLRTSPLISHRFAIDDAPSAYDLLVNDADHLGLLLEYPQASETKQLLQPTVALEAPRTISRTYEPVAGLIGAGAYASQVLVPALKKSGVTLKSVASSGGTSAAQVGRKHGFQDATSDSTALLADAAIDAVVIATRHDSHAALTCAALNAGKHVFVEKPLAIDGAQLKAIEKTYRATRARDHAPILMVGFNRRFAPHVKKIHALLQDIREPKTFIMTVNAGAIPSDHWTQDPAVGGGRIIGEGCHFIDLLRYLAGAPITDIKVLSTGHETETASRSDKVSFMLRFAEGSVGTVHYLANGHRAFPKERLDIFCAGRILQMDNFRKLRAYGWPGSNRMKLWRQDKGNAACIAAFVDTIRTGKPAPIPFTEMVEVTRASFEVVGGCLNLADPKI